MSDQLVINSPVSSCCGLHADDCCCPANNVFCATGPGGGVDPTCSPAGKRSAAVQTLKNLHSQAISMSLGDLEKQVEDAIKGLSKNDADEVLKGLGYSSKSKNKEEAIKRLRQHVIGHRGTMDRMFA